MTARQSAAEKSWKGPTRAGNPKSISAADSPACDECRGQLDHDSGRGLCNTCYQGHLRRIDTDWALHLAWRRVHKAQVRNRKFAALNDAYDAYWRAIGLTA